MRTHGVTPHGLPSASRFILFLLVLVPPPVLSASAGGEEAKRDAKEAAKMVEAIVNRNKAPRIVTRERYLPHKVPLFPKDYDWKEEERVRDVLAKLKEDTSVELWESLVQKETDGRYCVALFNDNSEDGEIVTVGRICGDLAYFRLCDVFLQHLPKDPNKDALLGLDTGIRDLATWRKARSEKSLYQLQIEVCEAVLRELAKTKRISDEEKTPVREQIEAEIANLRKTRRPVGRGYFPGRTYDRKTAERIRKAYEKGTLDKLQLDLIK